MTACDLTFNDWLQWISIGVILAIVVASILRRSVRFGRKIKNGDLPSCSSGCSGCGTPCDLRDLRRKSPPRSSDRKE